MTIGQAIIEIPERVDKLEFYDIREEIGKRAIRASVPLYSSAVSTLVGPSPSAPGATPGAKTNSLRRFWIPFAYMESFGIESGVEYSTYLEHGTMKMAARPYVEKVKRNAMPEIIRIFSELGR